MYRLFVAVDLPPSAKAALAALCHGLPRARWVTPEQMHLTLRFIGEVGGDAFADIAQALAEIRAPAFPLALKGLGHFPPGRAPRVLWVGIVRSEALVHLRDKVESALVRAGLAPEGRKFTPHVTLARLNTVPVTKVGAYLAHHALFEVPPFAVDAFHLYSSHLGAAGAIHTREASYPLSPARETGEAAKAG